MHELTFFDTPNNHRIDQPANTVAAAEWLADHPFATLVIDPYNDRVISANHAACELLEYSEQQLLKMPASALHPGYLASLTVFTEAVLHRGSGWTSDISCQTRSGREIPVEFSASRLGALLPDNPSPLMMVAFQDKRMLEKHRADADANRYLRKGLSEWRRVERLFSEIEAENQLILQAAGDGIYGVNADGITTFVNPAATRLLGWTAAELVGKNMHSLVHHSHADGSPYHHRDCPIYAAFRDGAVHRVEEEIFWCKDGSALPVEYTSTPIIDHGKAIGAVIIFRDISARKQAETELRRALEEVQRLKDQLESENAYLQEEIRHEKSRGEIVGSSLAIRRVFSQVEQVAGTDATVLIQGESGTGKELIARAIHQLSPRAAMPLVRVNCAAIPRELFESEFFGHVKGAFTGAIKDRIGRFQLADGGTLFLDEIGEIPLELQGKLLRVLQEGQFERVGEERTRQVNIRLVVATNRDLLEEIRQKRFREDLYFRLNVFPIESVPLRDRLEDIPLLASHFLQRLCKRLNVRDIRLTQADVEHLQNHDWPGNVRELENVMERAVISARNGRLQIILPENTTETFTSSIMQPTPPARQKILTEAEKKRREKESIILALKQAEGKVFGPGGAAEILGVKPTTLASRMKRLNISKYASSAKTGQHQ